MIQKMLHQFNKTTSILKITVWFIAILICETISHPVYSYNNVSISDDDKLNQILNEIKDIASDSVKINRYIEEGWAYHTTQLDNTSYLALKAEELARRTNNKVGLAKAKNLQGVAESIKGSYRISNSHNEEALSLALELNDTTLLSKVYNCIAINYSTNENTYDKAYEYYKKTLEYNSKDTIGYINTYANLSSLFRSMELKDKELNAINEVIKITENDKNYKGMNLQFRINKLLLTGDTIQANKLIDQLIQLEKSEKANYRLIFSYLDKSIILLSQKKYTQALKILDEAMSVIEQYGYENERDEVNNQRALTYAEMGNYPEAIKHLETIDESKNTYIQATEKLCEMYEKNGDYKAALKYAKKYKVVTDSLNSIKSKAHISELETLYDTEKKENENQQLKLQSAEIRNQLNDRQLIMQYLLAGLGIMILLSAYFYNQDKQRRKYNEQLATQVNDKTKSLKIANDNLLETNKELEAFTYVAAHDLMTPLRSITSFSGLIKKKNIDVLDASSLDYFDHIDKSSRWMSELIEDLLVFTKLEKEEYIIEKIGISHFFNEVKSHLKSQIDKKNATIIVDNKIDFIEADRTRLKQVFQNLISNSIKYTADNIDPIIKISINKSEEGTHYIISDNGIGIEEKYHKMIFNPFKRLHSKDQYEGSGIGLYICKKIINKAGGKIYLKNNSNGGTSFFFHIPHTK